MRAWILALVMLAACSPSSSREAAPATPPVQRDPGEASVSISSFNSYGNCMPRMIGPGSAPVSPHITVWNLDVEGATSLAIESAVLTIGADDPLRFELELEEPEIALQGGAFHGQQRVKSYRNGPSFGACGEMCRSAAATKLTLTLRIDGRLTTVKAEGEYSCAH